jgi:hypothetical protein
MFTVAFDSNLLHVESSRRGGITAVTSGPASVSRPVIFRLLRKLLLGLQLFHSPHKVRLGVELDTVIKLFTTVINECL